MAEYLRFVPGCIRREASVSTLGLGVGGDMGMETPGSYKERMGRLGAVSEAC